MREFLLLSSCFVVVISSCRQSHTPNVLTDAWYTIKTKRNLSPFLLKVSASTLNDNFFQKARPFYNKAQFL